MNNIRKMRTKNKITQKQLGRLCGVKPTTVSMWETESHDVPVKHLKLMSRLFGCSIDYLLCNELENATGAEFNPLESIYKQLNTTKRDELTNYASFLLQQQRNEGKTCN